MFSLPLLARVGSAVNRDLGVREQAMKKKEIVLAVQRALAAWITK